MAANHARLRHPTIPMLANPSPNQPSTPSRKHALRRKPSQSRRSIPSTVFTVCSRVWFEGCGRQDDVVVLHSTGRAVVGQRNAVAGAAPGRKVLRWTFTFDATVIQRGHGPQLNLVTSAGPTRRTLAPPRTDLGLDVLLTAPLRSPPLPALHHRRRRLRRAPR